MGLLDLGKSLKISQRPLDIIYVIDTSGSMGGAKIEAVNKAMHELEELLRAESRKNPSAEVNVRILAFNNNYAYWHLEERTRAEDFHYRDITYVNGATPLGDAFRVLGDALDNENMPKRGLAPVIILISDGWPTDEWRIPLNRLLSLPWGKKAVKIAIAIGNEPDKNILATFTEDIDHVLSANHTSTLKDFIKWTSTLVSQVSQHISDIDKDGNPSFAKIKVPEPVSMITDDSGEII